MRQDDGQLREVRGHVIEQHGRRVSQFDPAAAGQARADPGLPGVEERDYAQCLQLLIERVVAAIVGFEGLQAGVELEAADAVAGHQRAGLPDGRRAAVGINRSERDEHVGVLRGEIGDFLARQGRVAGRGRRVDREYHGPDPALAVMRGDMGQCRGPVLARGEIAGRGIKQFLVQGEAAVAVLFDVDVDVDRDQRLGIQHAGHPP